MATVESKPAATEMKHRVPRIGPWSAGDRMTVDYEEKRDEYLAAGVKEDWIIDRFRRVVTVYRKGHAGPTYDLVTESQSYETGLFPGFVLPLSRLFAKADNWTSARRRDTKTNSIPSAGGTDG
jgi:hypothetical protein